jgi:type IV pilus assembly protein PilC
MSNEQEPNRPEGIIPPSQVRRTGSGLSLDDFILLNEEIAGMARAGLPLDQGLAALAREMGRGQLQQVTATIAEDLRAGHTLPQALDRQGGQVPPFYANLLAAGIRTGRVGDVLSTLTVYARTLSDLRSTILSALFYPTIVLVMSFGLLFFLSYYLVPQFELIFQDFRMKLPAFTVFIIFLSHHTIFLFMIPVVMVAGLLLFRWGMHRSREGKMNWAWFVYKIPLVGTLVRSARLAAFTDLLGLLVDHGLPLPEAFRLAGEASSDPYMATGARQIEHALAQGQPLGVALGRSTMVPEVVSWMIGLGEKRGSLASTLHQVAEMYRRQVEMRANLLKSILPPFLIILVAGIIMGLFVLALMLPLLGLMEGLSGGHK